MTINAFPRIPHLPGSHADLDDLVLSDEDTARFFKGDIEIYEKADGMNLAIAVERDALVFALKYDWRQALGGAVERAIRIYLLQREAVLRRMLKGGAVLYGEWLWHRIHVRYDRLPDVFIPFAFQDAGGEMLPRRAWTDDASKHGFALATPIWRGRVTGVKQVKRMVGRSTLGRGRMEGLILEHPRPHSIPYAKWVDHAYVHQRKGRVSGERNVLASVEKLAVVVR